MKHIFIHIRTSQYNVFFGIQKNLENDNDAHHEIINLRLSSESYATFDKVEYSHRRRYFRFLFYKKLFREVENLTKEAILSNDNASSEVIIYIADEGLWAVLLEHISKKWNLNVCKVNVQHGFFYLQRPSEFSLFVRKKINNISVFFTGYPSFGLGFGSGLFDIYLVYGEKEKKFIEIETSALVFSAPKLIKKDFISDYQKVKKAVPKEQKLILFALSLGIISRFSSVKCTLIGIFKEITPLAKYLSDAHDIKLLLRFHPGTDTKEALAFLKTCELRHYALVDNEKNVVTGIAKSVAVMSYNSTVLFEAGLVGVTPIVLYGNCCEQGVLTYPHEIVDLNGDYRAMLDQALNKETAAHYLRPFNNNLSGLDWRRIVVQLASTSHGHDA
jgi:hypothetical protein